MCCINIPLLWAASASPSWKTPEIWWPVHDTPLAEMQSLVATKKTQLYITIAVIFIITHSGWLENCWMASERASKTPISKGNQINPSLPGKISIKMVCVRMQCMRARNGQNCKQLGCAGLYNQMTPISQPATSDVRSQPQGLVSGSICIAEWAKKQLEQPPCLASFEWVVNFTVRDYSTFWLGLHVLARVTVVLTMGMQDRPAYNMGTFGPCNYTRDS